MAMRVIWAGVLAALFLKTGPATVEVSRATPAAQMPGSIPMFVWTLTSFPGGEIGEATYSIQFMPDGTVAIGADCNRAGGI